MNAMYLVVFLVAVVLLGLLATPIAGLALLVIGGALIGFLFTTAARKADDPDSDKPAEQIERETPETGMWGEAKDPADIGETEKMESDSP